MTGRWEALTDRQRAVVLLNLRSWLDLGDDPDIRAALTVLDPEPAPLVVPYQGGRHTGTPTIDLLGQEAS